MNRFFLALLSLLSASCLSPVNGASLDAGASDSGVAPLDAGASCLAKETVALADVNAGRAFLLDGHVGGNFIPRAAWDNLYLVWGVGRPADMAATARARYGFAPALTENDGLPMGLTQSGNQVRADCRICHAGVVAGETVIGAPNNQVDLELLVDDLKALGALVGMDVSPGVTLRTGARGVGDIIGMTIQLGQLAQPSPVPANTEIGFQDPPAWWGVSAKTRLYTDGSAPAAGHRTFMATQLAFDTTQAQLEALEPQYVQLRSYIVSLTAPAWPFEAPASDSVERGRAVYQSQCASCHGAESCEKTESVEVARASVGTDPVRSEKFGTNEVGSINASWFGARDPMRVTAGYVAPPLRGVWASAPYFHNGSVPTIAAVLESSKRPKFFRIIGTGRDDYDSVNVGLKVETFEQAPVNPPRASRAAVYDTTVSGLGNGGHTYGDSLTTQQRTDVIAFLKTR